MAKHRLYDPQPDGYSYPSDRCQSAHAIVLSSGDPVTVRCELQSGHWSARGIAIPHRWRSAEWEGVHIDPDTLAAARAAADD